MAPETTLTTLQPRSRRTPQNALIPTNISCSVPRTSASFPGDNDELGSLSGVFTDSFVDEMRRGTDGNNNSHKWTVNCKLWTVTKMYTTVLILCLYFKFHWFLPCIITWTVWKWVWKMFGDNYVHICCNFDLELLHVLYVLISKPLGLKINWFEGKMGRMPHLNLGQMDYWHHVVSAVLRVPCQNSNKPWTMMSNSKGFEGLAGLFVYHYLFCWSSKQNNNKHFNTHCYIIKAQYHM